VRTAAVVASALFLSILAGSCGGGSSGPRVADLGGTTASTPSAAGSPQESKQAGDALEYSRCMRAHGLPDFPDPSANGGINLSDQPGSDLNPNSTAFQAAARSCASIQGFGAPSAARQRQYIAEMLPFARCVRAQGLPNFPDPSTLGSPYQGIGFLIDRNSRHSPVLQAAIKACQDVVHTGLAFKSYG
jgi:hypothetical protein